MRTLYTIISTLCIYCCAAAQPINYPHQAQHGMETSHSSFAEAPKTLDPARAYSSNEIQIIAQIMEPVVQYDYYKRPYTLTSLTTTSLPSVRFLDAQFKPLHQQTDSKHIAYSVYTIRLKPGIMYAPHPAFAKNSQGQLLYQHLSPKQIESYPSLGDFPHQGTRALKANDYVYEIKRLGDPHLNSPIYGLMKNYILGLSGLRKTLQTTEQQSSHFINLNDYPLRGAKALDNQTFEITIKGYYPQFRFWLAMTFFAPIPWEVDQFYAQPGMKQHNFSFNWQPVGTGPYMLIENNPNKQMILQKNPNFHQELFPKSNDPEDIKLQYTKHAGSQLPLNDRLVLSLDKESIPRWNKFLQGYYDRSGIAPDSFDQAIQLDQFGNPMLTPNMQAKGIRLDITTAPSTYYMGFNMQDPIVGGLSEAKQKLRQAISIALDYEEYIQIFLNGRGMVAHSPIPPGIFGNRSGQAGMNPFLYNWKNEQASRKSIAYAKRLLAEAGYPGGINPKTKQALILNYDVAGGNSPDDKARFDWMRKQFKKLGIQLNIRSTLYNRFQEKVRTGGVQIFSWGWNADYPDPENFLFLLHGPNGKMKYHGENATNYDNPKFNLLFEQIKNMPDSPARQLKIDQALHIVQQDAPWVFGLHPIQFTLSHQWVDPIKPNAMANNHLKYQNINQHQRVSLQKKWNQPEYEIILFLALFVLLLAIPLWISYHRKQKKPNVAIQPPNKEK